MRAILSLGRSQQGRSLIFFMVYSNRVGRGYLTKSSRLPGTVKSIVYWIRQKGRINYIRFVTYA